MNDLKTIILSAGGTGGHVFPALATAEKLQEQGYRCILISDDRTVHYRFPEGLTVHHLPMSHPNKWMRLSRILMTLPQAQKIVKQADPECIIGFGGYPSFPALLAGFGYQKRLYVHEQNRYLGRANRFAGKFINKIALSFPDTQGISPRLKRKSVISGNPARAEIEAIGESPYIPSTAGEPFNILIFGGSLGASIFTDIVPQAIAKLSADQQKRLRITQQCRADDVEIVTAAYQKLGIEAEISTFFEDMPAQLAKAQLVICRAGASTVTEIMAAGRPAIFIPLPNSANNHQRLNAQYMEQSNAGWLVPQTQFDADTLATRLDYSMTQPKMMAQTAKAARALYLPNAAEKIAEFAI